MMTDDEIKTADIIMDCGKVTSVLSQIPLKLHVGAHGEPESIKVAAIYLKEDGLIEVEQHGGVHFKLSFQPSQEVTLF